MNNYRAMAWENSIHTFGTSYVFQQRARKLKWRLQLVNYVGAAVPFVIGTLVLTFGTFDLIDVAIAIAGAILVPQAAINLWAVFGAWVERHSYAVASAAANDNLAVRYQELGRNPPDSLSKTKLEYEKLQVEDKSRRDQDLQHDVSDEEKRMGMRAALRKIQRQCASCGMVPASMKPTDCDVCGNF